MSDSRTDTECFPTVAERLQGGMAELEAIMAAGTDPRRALSWRAVEVREPAASSATPPRPSPPGGNNSTDRGG